MTGERGVHSVENICHNTKKNPQRIQSWRFGCSGYCVCFDVCLPEKEEKLSESINEDRLKLSKIVRKYTLVNKDKCMNEKSPQKMQRK